MVAGYHFIRRGVAEYMYPAPPPYAFIFLFLYRRIFRDLIRFYLFILSVRSFVFVPYIMWEFSSRLSSSSSFRFFFFAFPFS